MFEPVLEQRRMSVLKGFFSNIVLIITTISYFPSCDSVLSSETPLLSRREPGPKSVHCFAKVYQKLCQMGNCKQQTSAFTEYFQAPVFNFLRLFFPFSPSHQSQVWGGFLVSFFVSWWIFFVCFK